MKPMYGGVEVQRHVFLTSVLDWGECLITRPGHFTPEERDLGPHLIGGWVDPRVSLHVTERENPVPLSGINVILWLSGGSQVTVPPPSQFLCYLCNMDPEELPLSILTLTNIFFAPLNRVLSCSDVVSCCLKTRRRYVTTLMDVGVLTWRCVTEHRHRGQMGRKNSFCIWGGGCPETSCLYEM
jgi:hypothetical protein